MNDKQLIKHLSNYIELLEAKLAEANARLRVVADRRVTLSGTGGTNSGGGTGEER